MADALARQLAAHQEWLRTQGTDGTRLELPEARLRGADLRDADLRLALLPGADLHGADLRGADLDRAVLTGADLGGADLTGARLTRADLSGARAPEVVLRRATLVRTDLEGADLSRADLSRAYLVRTYLVGADLRGADLTEADFDGVLVDRSMWGDLQVRDATGTVVSVDDTTAADVAGRSAAAGGRLTVLDLGAERAEDALPWRWADA